MNVKARGGKKKIESLVMEMAVALARVAPHPDGPGGGYWASAGTLAGRFNPQAGRAARMEAWMRDLPRRRGLERRLAECRRLLCAPGLAA